MNNVIEFPDLSESCKYTNHGGSLGVIDEYSGSELFFDHEVAFFAIGSDVAEFKNRQDLAEFLWMCVRLVDSEGRWEKSEYVGMDY